MLDLSWPLPSPLKAVLAPSGTAKARLGLASLLFQKVCPCGNVPAAASAAMRYGVLERSQLGLALLRSHSYALRPCTFRHPMHVSYSMAATGICVVAACLS